jgi:hypothetical protein
MGVTQYQEGLRTVSVCGGPLGRIYRSSSTQEYVYYKENMYAFLRGVTLSWGLAGLACRAAQNIIGPDR